MSDLDRVTDVNGLIKPQEAWNNSGNGVLYTAIACEIGLISHADALIRISKCLDFDRRVLRRTPDNQFGQESHDNWAGALVIALNYPQTGEMLTDWIASRFGFMQNRPGFKNFMSSQMLRFIHLWPLIIANRSESKILRSLCGYALKALLSLDKIKIEDASGAQLCFLKALAISKLLSNDIELNKFYVKCEQETGLKFYEIMEPYYSHAHPIVERIKILELNEA